MSDLGNLRDFLTSRRRSIDPWEVGLPASAVPRRRPGLRREEVAVLAGVSVDYYMRLEQGCVGNVSDQVLNAVAKALNLDDTEYDYLRRLVSAEPLVRLHNTPSTKQPGRSRLSARPAVAELVRVMEPVPAILQGPPHGGLGDQPDGCCAYSRLRQDAAAFRRGATWFQSETRFCASSPRSVRLAR
ncbi:helix-turn-helix transcriptional regulator [Propionimicrobium sp. PCR01-08-3]|uniref:helix-turn-helix domain-containing protein n=1 Tax=Propionimicrobium sp. PCR01-08-3 TaxID=3052086 RepID=UPI00333FB9A5